MRRIMLEVAYDGTQYHGWQLQQNAVTIEGVLNQALSDLLKEDIQVIGASRTDAGVHALCNVAVFDTNARIPAEKIAYALNAYLPEDIKIQSSKETMPDFHPRKCSSRKTYVYRIHISQFPNPMERLYSHYIYTSLDIKKMQKAAEYLVGEHDFKSFCSVNSQAETTIRTIYKLEVDREKEDIVITVSGNGFLYNMVRIIAGTLIEVGAFKRTPEEMEAILFACDRRKAGPTAPAKGLMLAKYEILDGGHKIEQK